jgi:hypothetical protein
MNELARANTLPVCWRWYLRRWLHRMHLVPRISSQDNIAVHRPLRRATLCARLAQLGSGLAGSQQA